MIELHNSDCLEAMRLMEDNSFELAIVDPPYGIGMSGGKKGSIAFGKKKDKKIIHKKKDWDNEIPSKEYFDQLKRVSKNQIIWGGNYFLDYLGATRCFCVWDKMNGGNSMADCELAWTSFFSSSRMYSGHIFTGIGNSNYISYHPTQKPVALYTWLLEKLCKEGRSNT
jgi:site-specific DNA-methyltransferase (adenine-specific)